MKQPNYKQKIITKIDELLAHAGFSYGVYNNILNCLIKEPLLFLEGTELDRAKTILKELFACIEQAEMLLQMLFQDNSIKITNIPELKTFCDTKKITIKHKQEILISKTKTVQTWETKEQYKLYNAHTGKLESFAEIKSTTL